MTELSVLEQVNKGFKRSLNEPDRFRLAVVRIDGDDAAEPVYVTGYDFGQPGFEQTTATFRLSSLLRHGGPPA